MLRLLFAMSWSRLWESAAQSSCANSRKKRKIMENHSTFQDFEKLPCYLCWCYLRQSKLLRHLLSCTATTSCTRTDFEATAGRWSFFVTAVVVWSVQDLKPQNIMLAESLKWDLNDLNGRWYTIAECYWYIYILILRIMINHGSFGVHTLYFRPILYPGEQRLVIH